MFKETPKNADVRMDKLVLGFIADILYIKGFICYDEFEDIMNAKFPSDLQDIVEKMLRGEYDGRKRGEGYILSGDEAR